MAEYQVIARKWRPQRFADVVGQEHVVRTLTNAIRQDRTAHAYLFVGPRGVGKTTLARIFAKAMNCEQPRSGEPCCECESCKSIAADNSMDVVEIDAASHNSAQEMRDLAVDVTEADLVRKIFRLTISEGAGSNQIASILNKEGFRTHGGAEFQSNHILRILKNSIYCGFLKNGEATSDRIESLRIIDDHDFAMAQEILRQRAHKSDEKRTIALHNKGKALLSGNIFCAHCGCRLTTSRYVEEYCKQDGTEVCTE